MGVQRFTWWWVFQHIEVQTGVQSLINKQMMKHVEKKNITWCTWQDTDRAGQSREDMDGMDGVKGDSLIRFRGVGKVRGQQGQWEVVVADLVMGADWDHRVKILISVWIQDCKNQLDAFLVLYHWPEFRNSSVCIPLNLAATLGLLSSRKHLKQNYVGIPSSTIDCCTVFSCLLRCSTTARLWMQ